MIPFRFGWTVPIHELFRALMYVRGNVMHDARRRLTRVAFYFLTNAKNELNDHLIGY
jgi:hypothetical protein